MITTLERPNGKTYKPRKVGLQAHAWENHDYGDCGVIVFGTQDIEEATPLAIEWCKHWFGYHAVTGPYTGWFRLTYDMGELAWMSDPVKGRPGVYFTATDT